MIPPVVPGPDLAGYRATRLLAGESGGTVDRLDADGRPTLFLKHGSGRLAEDIADEAARLAWLAGRVEVPTIRHFARTANEAWLLTTAMPGETVDAVVDGAPDRLPGFLEPLAAFLRRLHALPVVDCPFEAGAPLRLAAARRNLEAGLVDADDFGPDHAGWTPGSVWEEMMRLRPASFGRVVTHGDWSLGNVLVAGDIVTGCIDVGRAGIADPYQDLAVLWANLEENGAGLGDRFLRAYGVATPDRDRLAFHLCLDEFF